MRVLVVDDDKLVTASLKTILEADNDIEVVGTGNSGKQAVDMYFALKPDVLLMDIRMNGMTGIEAAETIIDRDNKARILFLTTFSDDEYIVKAFRIGAKGYILKQNFESINSSVKAVYMGQRVFGDEIITKIPILLNDSAEKDTGKSRMNNFNLSQREIEIITQVANGLSNREISEMLFLSEGTVRNYISAILEKLNLRDRTQLAIFYYKNL
ncbi:MAG TPA: response regulator transcription factor [Clostridiaceae bacterium]|nr:response regulator transcription factor [Clostridiaceae bacterium]